MKKYSLGIIFDSTYENVLMAKRVKEPFKDKINGIGGKIEEGEDCEAAMLREFLEETPIKENELDKMIYAMTTNFAIREQLNIFYIILKEGVFAGQELDTREGLIKWYNIKKDNLMDVNNDNLAGDGNIPYLIKDFLNNKDRYIEMNKKGG